MAIDLIVQHVHSQLEEVSQPPRAHPTPAPAAPTCFLFPAQSAGPQEGGSGAPWWSRPELRLPPCGGTVGFPGQAPLWSTHGGVPA